MARQAAIQQLRLEVAQVEPPGKHRVRHTSETKQAKLGPRLALSPDEAASALGVSRDYLDEHVIGELRIVRRGRRILIALSELERWLERSAIHGTAIRGT